MASYSIKITIEKKDDGSYKASTDYSNAELDSNDNVTFTVGTKNWYFDTSEQSSVPNGFESLTCDGNATGFYIKNPKDFSVVGFDNRPARAVLVVHDTKSDKKKHDKHDYRVYVTDGTNKANTDPYIRDKNLD